MDISTTENLKTVRDSNQEILDYFNELYVEKLEQIQTLKTEQFELKIKIDELMKTLSTPLKTVPDIMSFLHFLQRQQRRRKKLHRLNRN